MIQIGIQSEELNDIINGKKTVEGRLAKGKFLDIRPGDTISIREDQYIDGVFTSSIDDCIRIKIDDLFRFNSFEEMLVAVGFYNAIPSAKDIIEALSKYRFYYSEVQEINHGVIAFKFHVVTP